MHGSLRQFFDFGLAHPCGIWCLSWMANQTEFYWMPDNRLSHGKKRRSNQLASICLEDSSQGKNIATLIRISKKKVSKGEEKKEKKIKINQNKKPTHILSKKIS